MYRIRPLQKSLSCLLGFQALTRNLTAGAFYRSERRHRRHVIRLLTLFSFLSFSLSLSLIYAKLARTQVSLSSPVGEKIKEKKKTMPGSQLSRSPEIAAIKHTDTANHHHWHLLLLLLLLVLVVAASLSLSCHATTRNKTKFLFSYFR